LQLSNGVSRAQMPDYSCRPAAWGRVHLWGAGNLEISGTASDADLLAVSGAAAGDDSHVLALDARNLRVGGELAVSVTSATTMEVDRMQRAINLRLEMAREGKLTIDGVIVQGSFTMDSMAVQGAVKELNIAHGSHNIRFIVEQ
jgi:hypothetical protein